MIQNEQMLSSREVARQLGTTVTTVNRWVKAGKIAAALEFPGYRGQRLFAASEVARVRAERRPS